jgi:hypothetical protein
VSLIGGWSATIKTKTLIDKVQLVVMQGLDPGCTNNTVSGRVSYSYSAKNMPTIPMKISISGKIII